MGIELTKSQIFATYKGKKWYHEQNDQLFLIEGAPGTGKTTMVLCLIEELGLHLDQVLFLTYMGKAANQLSKHGLPAKTIDSTIYNYLLKTKRDEDGMVVLDELGHPKKEWVKELKPKLKKGLELIVLDEYRMVDQTRGNDILQYGIPVIALGDRFQLDPPFGKPFTERDPDVTLREIMRQATDSPVIYLSQKILHNERLDIGVYGSSQIIRRSMLDPMHLKTADIVITESNKLRYKINQIFREHFRNYKQLERLHVGEKVICKRNNWQEEINKFFLTNGTAGVVDEVSTYRKNKKTTTISFQADYLDRPFKNLLIDYDHLFGTPEENAANGAYVPGINLFEFAYAITVYSSQGSEWNNVLCFDERIGSQEFRRKALFTAVTRARQDVTIVLP